MLETPEVINTLFETPKTICAFQFQRTIVSKLYNEIVYCSDEL